MSQARRGGEGRENKKKKKKGGGWSGGGDFGAADEKRGDEKQKPGDTLKFKKKNQGGMKGSEKGSGTKNHPEGRRPKKKRGSGKEKNRAENKRARPGERKEW